MNSRPPDDRPVRFIVLFMLAHFGHHVLTALVVPLLPFIREEFGLDYAGVGVVASAFTLAYGIAQLPAGWLADRVGARTLLAVGIAGVAAAGFLVGLSWGYAPLLAFLVLMGLAGGGYHPSAPPMISAAVGEKRKGRALGLHVIGGSASHFLAPILGVALAAAAGWRGAFLYLSLPVAAIGVLLFIFLRPGEGGEDGAPADSGEAVRGSSPPALPAPLAVAAMVLIASVTGAFLQSAISFVPLFAVDGLGTSETAAALFLSLVYLAGFWGAPAGGFLSDKLGKERLIPMVSLATGAGIAILALVPAGPLLWVLLLGLGSLMFLRMPVAEAFILEGVPEARRSTVLGLYYFAGMEGGGVLTPLVGRLIDRFGFRIAFASSGGMLMLLVLGLLGVAAMAKRSAPEPPRSP